MELEYILKFFHYIIYLCRVGGVTGGTISTTQKAKPDGAKKVKYEAKTSKKLGSKKQKGKGVAITKQLEKNCKVTQSPTQSRGCFIFNGPHRACD